MASDAPSSARGLWRKAGSAHAVEATISVSPEGIVAISDAFTRKNLAAAHIGAVSVSDRVGSIPRHVTFSDQSAFESRDNDAVDALFAARSGGYSNLVHRLEQFRPRLLIFVILVIGFGFALYRYAVPVLVEVAVAVTPPVVPQLMSKSVMLSLDKTVFDKTGLSAERQQALSAQFAQIAALTPLGDATRPSAGYTLNFRKGGAIGANAFALPDGTVVLTDELVELAGGDDEAVLGVLAHEIGHVDDHHSLRQLYRAAGATALVMLIGGDIGSGAEDILIQGSALISLSYSRGAEAQADRYSVELMHKAGKDPEAIARFFERLSEKLGDADGGGFLSTHPATPERIAETRRYARELIAAAQ